MPFYDCLSPAPLHHDWHAELYARAAARAHFWLAEQLPATLPQTTNYQAPAGIPSRRPLRSQFVTRSQILRAFEPLALEELEERQLDTEQMIRHSEAARHAVSLVLQPEIARSNARPLRPPNLEEQSIRGPPHRPAGRAETNPAEERHKYEYSNSIACTVAVTATGTTSKERNKFPTAARTYLSSARLRVLNQRLRVACAVRKDGQLVLQRTNSCLSVCLASWTEVGEYCISSRYSSEVARATERGTKEPESEFETQGCKYTWNQTTVLPRPPTLTRPQAKLSILERIY